MSFDISCHLRFQVILDFVSFEILCHCFMSVADWWLRIYGGRAAQRQDNPIAETLTTSSLGISSPSHFSTNWVQQTMPTHPKRVSTLKQKRVKNSLWPGWQALGSLSV